MLIWNSFVDIYYKKTCFDYILNFTKLFCIYISLGWPTQKTQKFLNTKQTQADQK